MMSLLLDYIEHNFILLFALSGILVVTETSERDEHGRSLELRLLMAIIFALSIVDCVNYDIEIYGGPLMLRITAAVLGYCMRPMIGLLAICMVDPSKRKEKWFFLPLLLNALVYVTCFFSGICISFANNGFVKGPLYATVYVISLFYILMFLFEISRHMKNRFLSENLVVVYTCVLVFIAAVVDSFQERNTFLFPILAVGLLFYYVYLQLQRRKLRELQWELKQQEQQNQLMISQIQPHFMYNTLATVGYLCTVDPDLAEHTINQFSDYLRQNMSVIGTNAPVPFVQELKHTRIYTEIEKLRFDNIEVLYQIEDEEFLIPALTVQPIVENAIRHGVRAREHGIVEIHTWKVADYHMLEIKDNGVGFDPNASLSTERLHIGLKNVRARLEGMVGGSMSVESVIGQGSRILIRIPVQEERS